MEPRLSWVHIGVGEGPVERYGTAGGGGLGWGRIHLAMKKKPGGDVGGDVPLMSQEGYSLGGGEPGLFG